MKMNYELKGEVITTETCLLNTYCVGIYRYGHYDRVAKVILRVGLRFMNLPRNLFSWPIE